MEAIKRLAILHLSSKLLLSKVVRRFRHEIGKSFDKLLLCINLRNLFVFNNIIFWITLIHVSISVCQKLCNEKSDIDFRGVDVTQYPTITK